MTPSTHRLRGAAVALLLGISAFSCGGSKPPAEAPESAGAPTSSAEAEPAAKTDMEPEPGASAEAKPAPKPEPEEKKPLRTAQDMLTAPDVVFMFSFNSSDAKQAAEDKCRAQGKSEPRKLNPCLAQARKQFDIDGYRFKQQDDKWFLLSVQRAGNRLITVHKFEIEFDKDSEHSVIVKPMGKDLGKKPGRTPAEIEFQVPNENQIVINDPKFGKLVYDAKIGIASGND